MNTVSLVIDGKKVTAQEGEKVLWAALDNGIYIPNLCGIRESSEQAASCRLCFIEIAGYDEPVTACTEPVREGLVVNTRGPKARRLARTSFELLLASYDLDCAHCPKNRRCDIQKIAAHIGVKLNTKRFRRLPRNLPVDDSSPLFTYNPNRCVLCGRCVWVCREHMGPNQAGAIGFAERGFKRIVAAFGGAPFGQSRCQQCTECISVCPAGALVFKDSRATQPDQATSAQGSNTPDKHENTK